MAAFESMLQADLAESGVQLFTQNKVISLSSEKCLPWLIAQSVHPSAVAGRDETVIWSGEAQSLGAGRRAGSTPSFPESSPCLGLSPFLPFALS